MPNRLGNASSPYLRQHAGNPVDWWEWGDEAFAEAAATDRPILLSVGYATCHWCHVMAHESFEDPDTARVMNDLFVSVKVDREERPDVDRIYMEAVQAMSGHGGWPMTVFLAPTGEPFFAGTYFPGERRGDHPSFRDVMAAVDDAWRTRRDAVVEQAGRLTAAVRARIPPGESVPGAGAVDGAVAALYGRFDAVNGGFGGAPKFPQAPDLELLLRVTALGIDPGGTAEPMLRLTLDRMAAGGIYDHLGGGFSRYSVDAGWRVPHFEKMLYDNALLSRIYLRAWQVTGEARYRSVATETLDYMLRWLADPGGGLYSGEDADSEGVEGKFYVWEWEDLAAAAGDELPLAAAAFGATPDGGFEGTNVLQRAQSIEGVAARLHITPEAARGRLGALRRRLLAHREMRERPSLDDKVVTAWNGLALRSLAEAGRILGDPRYREGARRLAGFLVGEVLAGGRLARTWRQGRRGPDGYCDDYAATAVGLLTLYAATGETGWFSHARDLVDTAAALFGDPDGGFYSTAEGTPHLISRPRSLYDNPTPSDNTLMAEALQMLLAYTGDERWGRLLEGTYRAAGRLIELHPTAVGGMVGVLAAGLDGPDEVAVVGDPELRRDLEDVVWETFRPGCVVAAGTGPDGVVPLLDNRHDTPPAPLAYVCRGFVCNLPVPDPDALRASLTPGSTRNDGLLTR